MQTHDKGNCLIVELPEPASIPDVPAAGWTGANQQLAPDFLDNGDIGSAVSDMAHGPFLR